MSVELVNFLSQHIVTSPEELEITTIPSSKGLLIEIRCADKDAGRIIGRGGRVINSIRTLARAAAEGRQEIEVQLVD